MYDLRDMSARARKFSIMDASDAQFIGAVETGEITSVRFSHRDHVRAGWSYVMRDGLSAAIAAMERTIRRIAAHHGLESKYHSTLTVVWVRLIAVHAAAHPHTSFDLFIAANGELLEKDLPLRFYSRERLFSETAQSGWMEPDLRSLPDVR
jgi:hypothetical protein